MDLFSYESIITKSIQDISNLTLYTNCQGVNIFLLLYLWLVINTAFYEMFAANRLNAKLSVYPETITALF